MDFASLMSAQIAQKSKPPPQQPGKDKADAAPATKYQRRADAEAAREAAYREQQAQREAERLAKDRKKREREEEEADKERERKVKIRRLAEESQAAKRAEEERLERERRRRIGLPELPTEEELTAEQEARDAAAAATDDMEDLQDEELVDKLRDMAQPARLFGEDHTLRLRRYRRLLNAANESAALKRSSKEPIPTNLESVPEAECKIADKVPPVSDATGRLFFARQMTTWFNLVLREWAIALAARDEATKKTLAGQQAASSLSQAILHLRPLFRKLERLTVAPEELPDDLLKPMGDIVRAAQERRYVHANDGYLQLSIGKAAWPIGVTMVGIHERSAREKISNDGGKAHIMTDEVTRKILQSIKRCLSFAQTRWPPEDVSQLMG